MRCVQQLCKHQSLMDACWHRSVIVLLVSNRASLLAQPGRTSA
jgi:hypothetical protein